MKNQVFWALAHAKDGSLGSAMTAMKDFAAEQLHAGTAFHAEWQDEICHLNESIPEIDTGWGPLVFPGTQLIERGLGNDAEASEGAVFVLDSDPLESPIITVVGTDYVLRNIDLTTDDGTYVWQEAGQ